MNQCEDDKSLDRGWEIEDPGHASIYAKAEPFLKTRLNTLHTRIAYAFAVRLVAELGGDPDIVFPAILLHDIGWSHVPENQQVGAFGPNVKRPDLQRLHELEGARMAGEILEAMVWPPESIREIQEIIAGHDTRLESLGLNDSIVKDADKLWRYTHEGFTIDYKRFGKTPHDNYVWLMASLPKWFFHEISKSIARQEALVRKDDYDIVTD